MGILSIALFSPIGVRMRAQKKPIKVIHSKIAYSKQQMNIEIHQSIIIIIEMFEYVIRYQEEGTISDASAIYILMIINIL